VRPAAVDDGQRPARSRVRRGRGADPNGGRGAGVSPSNTDGDAAGVARWRKAPPETCARPGECVRKKAPEVEVPGAADDADGADIHELQPENIGSRP